MTRSSIRTLLAGVAGAVALVASVPAFAQAVITITGAGCTAWQLSGSPPSQTLNCITGSPSTGKPACQVQGPSAGSVGTPIALVARCNPEATSFAWAGGSCAGKSGMTCMASEALTGDVGYTVTGTNANGTGSASPNFVVGWTAAPPPPPTGCSIARNPSNGQLTTAGGAITVTGSCSGTVTAWSWQRNGAAWGSNNASQGETLPQNTLTSPVTYTYTLTACNGASCAAPTSTTFTVAGTGGGGGGAISCAGFSDTIVIDAVWNTSPIRYLSSNFPPGFHNGVALVVRFTVPPGSPNSTSVGTIGSDEYYDGPHYRSRALSTQSCDWTSASVLNVWEGIGGTQRFSVGTNFGYPVLVPGQTYYFNIKNNMLNGSSTCGYGESCNVGIDWTKPPGT